MKGFSDNRGLKGKLLDKSIEAYILALEIINQLSIKYRVETFAYLVCNAWELMLKAKIIKDSKCRKTIYYKKKRNEQRRSLALRDCLKKVFINENDPTRRNIERIADLRDACVHLIISQIPKDILGLFQACVLNYHKHLVDWFGVSLSDRISVGMMTIVYDFNPLDFDLSNVRLRKQLGKDTFQYLSRFQHNIQKEFDEMGKPAEFSIDIEYKLGLVKNFQEGDIALTQGDAGEVMGLVLLPKDSSKTHPYLQKDVIKIINEKISSKTKFNQYDMQCINKVYDVKKRPEFFYQGKVPGSPGQYSYNFIELVLKKYNKDPDFFHKTRQKAKKETQLYLDIGQKVDIHHD